MSLGPQFTITRTRVTAAAFIVSVLGPLCEADGQELKIGIIDLYGLNRVSPGQIREALTFKEGDVAGRNFCNPIPRRLFDGLAEGDESWDVAPAADFFITLDRREPPQLHFVINWFDELKRFIPAK